MCTENQISVVPVDVLASGDRPCEPFFADKTPKLAKKSNTKSRRSIYKIVAGKAITEPDVTQKVKEYIKQSSVKSFKSKKPIQSARKTSPSHGQSPSVAASKVGKRSKTRKQSCSNQHPKIQTLYLVPLACNR
jgi:hypothetical protein